MYARFDQNPFDWHGFESAQEDALPHLLAVVEAASDLLAQPLGSGLWVRAEARLAAALGPLFEEANDDSE
jgi:hypothetical protein